MLGAMARFAAHHFRGIGPLFYIMLRQKTKSFEYQRLVY
jgi:hypothetical protein